MSIQTRGSDFIDDNRKDARILLDVVNRIKSRQREWNALDYGNTLPDGIGLNIGINRAEVGAFVFDTINGIIAYLDQGSATNIAKLL